MAKAHFTAIQFPLPLSDATIKLPLSKGYMAVIDAVDAEVAMHKWSSHITPEGVYAERSYQGLTKRCKERLHSVIMARVLGRPLERGEEVDHKDRDGLNNRRENLRLATSSQNKYNRKMQSNNQAGHKGIYYDKSRNKWIAKIGYQNRQIYLGRFNSPEAAFEAYCTAAAELHKEFARTE